MHENVRNSEKTVADHLKELRVRLLFILFFFVLFSCIAYSFYPEIESVLLRPLGDNTYYSSVTGGVEFIFNLTLLVGFVLTTPIALYNMLAFASPALPASHKIKPLNFVFYSYFFVILSIIFTYFWALPTILGFLSTFSSTEVKPLISTNEYLNFIKWYFLSFGIVFQLPIVLVTIDSFYSIPMKRLRAARVWVFISSLVFAALLVPTPEILKQFIFGIPILVFYELSIFIIWLRNISQELMIAEAYISLEDKAESLFKSKDYEAAKTEFLKILEAGFTSARLQNRLGAIYIHEKNFELAKDSLTKATKLDPKLVSAQVNLAIIYIEQNELNEAHTLLKRAVRLRPKNDKYRDMLLLVTKLQAKSG